MCQPGRLSRHHNASCCVPRDCGCMLPFRHYYSGEEERERLESYREQLRKELAGVEERIGEFESKNP